MKNHLDILASYEIYAFPLEELHPVEKGRFWFVYAPLALVSMLASPDDLVALADGRATELFGSLTDHEETDLALARRIKNVGDFLNLSVMPTNKCNFSCAYCYSASGRANDTLEWAQLCGMLDFFVDRRRNDTDRLSVTFLGGGEPLMASPLVRQAIEYARRRGREEGFEIVFKIVTNGSLSDDETFAVLAANDVEVTVSYEILEEVQNLHRGNHFTVTDNIKRLLAAGVSVTTNSVITPYNVTRMEEMVDVIAEEFPGLDYLSFEPVITLNEWSTDVIDDEFYNLFIEEFDKARRKAEWMGIELTCSVLRNVDCVVERYCAGELALCPEGSITICPCVSSPAMEHYGDYLYGAVSPEGSVLIDEDKLSDLLAYDVHSRSECRGCFARWNCGGGCLNAGKMETAEQKAIKCRFVRNFILRELWARTRREYENSFDKAIDEILR